MPDLLRKEPGGYVPGDIKSGRGKDGGDDEHDGKPKRHYAVQLALHVDILERLNRSARRCGFVWDIQGQEVAYDFSTLQGQSLWDDYEIVLADARAILARETIPLPAYASLVSASSATGIPAVSPSSLKRERKLPPNRHSRRSGTGTCVLTKVSPRVRSLILPEILEPIRCQCGVTDSRLD
jgi:hypothetical protein